MMMMTKLLAQLRQYWLRRQLLPEEQAILDAVREKYPAHPNDRIFFVREAKPCLPVRGSAVIQVWGSDGDGPWVHITNLARFMEDGMSIKEIMETQLG